LLTAALAARANHAQWPAGQPFVRGFSARYGPVAFNPSPAVRRFRPVYDASGDVVPTSYGAETGMIALAETVLRRAPSSGGILHRVELRGLGLAKVSFPHDLDLLQLNGAGLRKLGLTRGQLIDTGASAYPDTAAVAQTLYDANPTAHGIVWTSHQADDGDAFILWGTRLDPAAATILEGPVLLDDAHGLALVQTACERFGVLLVA
jgi:hypothetical protein